MRQASRILDHRVTRGALGRTLPGVFTTELTKRRAVDLVRVAAMLCRMP